MNSMPADSKARLMADENNTPPTGEGNLRIEGRRLVFEMRVILESVSHGLEALQARPEAVLIKEQLGVLRKLTHAGGRGAGDFQRDYQPAPGRLIISRRRAKAEPAKRQQTHKCSRPMLIIRTGLQHQNNKNSSPKLKPRRQRGI
jgi:hypothetical protein